MKKLFQTVFSHKTIDVVDATTGKKEKATYLMLFGASIDVKYKSAGTPEIAH
ncbi:hypothetical protein [Epilithonimonas arachidiradicis]|uniref:Uncharacterized protein n=1 Tax=Epilithonimonas arachidiradicis TaxID=1617282 RepID=A0A420DE36_9FLAO|nr:hypothetical protein [Epilithonimonas arachidiradicis]RKE90046.1 hypothetical protein BXY58_0632 [Epilithonimonas arachidiradicis]GGG47304.1 hypothetical protein GCM10007332_06030 [Epilithonimonas arachidiradicis]